MVHFFFCGFRVLYTGNVDEVNPSKSRLVQGNLTTLSCLCNQRRGTVLGAVYLSCFGVIWAAPWCLLLSVHLRTLHSAPDISTSALPGCLRCISAFLFIHPTPILGKTACSPACRRGLQPEGEGALCQCTQGCCRQMGGLVVAAGGKTRR